jgi:hypothetical protein
VIHLCLRQRHQCRLVVYRFCGGGIHPCNSRNLNLFLIWILITNQRVPFIPPRIVRDFAKKIIESVVDSSWGRKRKLSLENKNGEMWNERILKMVGMHANEKLKCMRKPLFSTTIELGPFCGNCLVRVEAEVGCFYSKMSWTSVKLRRTVELNRDLSSLGRNSRFCSNMLVIDRRKRSGNP